MLSHMEYVARDNLFADLDDMIEGKITQSSNLVTTDLVTLKRAPNVIHFIEAPEYLNGPELWPVQYEVIRDFLELLCPMCNDVQRIRTINDVPRRDQILFEYEVCPNCGLKKSDIVDDLSFYNEFVGCEGMRSGKGVTIGCLSAGLVHDALCTPDLQSRLRVIKRQTLDIAFVATSAQQASETVWGHFRAFYEESPWFQDLKEKLQTLEKTHPKYKTGKLYKETDKEIHFKYKNLALKALHSNSASLAGKTRLIAIIDELARFDTGDSKKSAQEVYRVLKRSLRTISSAVRRARELGIYNLPDARMISISSPMFEDDKIMQLLEQAQRQHKMFAFRKATWEANPEITQEDLADEFEDDPLGAERDYGANPPGAENPFIRDTRIIEACTDNTRFSIFDYGEKYFDMKVGNVIFSYIGLEIKNVKYKNLAEYAIHCDPGKKKDSFCLCIGHLEEDKVIIDGAVTLKPIPKGNKQKLKPREVYFPAMTALILELHKKLTIKYVSYDRWNSMEQIDRLRNVGILAMGKDIDRDDHIKFLESMRNNKLSFPAKEHPALDPYYHRNMPCSLALRELRGLQDNGVKVDHRSDGSNDMIQCYIGVHRLLKTPERVFTNKAIQDRHKVSMIRKANPRPSLRVIRLKRFV